MSNLYTIKIPFKSGFFVSKRRNSSPLKFSYFNLKFDTRHINEQKLGCGISEKNMPTLLSCPVVSGISIPAKDLRFSSSLCSSKNQLPVNSCGSVDSRHFVSRFYFSSKKLFQVRATTLQEDEEKVVVEKSFDPISFPEKEDAGTTSEGPALSDSASWVIKIEQSINVFLTESVIKILDTLYRDRDYARFFVLETIARVPYFAFMSVLHMYESFGWWRRADYLKVHFAESWNEMHHLLIMEELGGNAWWVDRFLAQHIAVFYYFMTAFMYALSPRMAYHFSECVENHAYETYDKFIKARKEELQRLPPPAVAVRYYTEGDLYLFDEFQTSRPPNSRRPKIENLYDVFLNIRDDEAEHCKTMKACQTHGTLRSPHSDFDDDDAFGQEDSECELSKADCEGIVDCIKKSISDPPAQNRN